MCIQTLQIPCNRTQTFAVTCGFQWIFSMSGNHCSTRNYCHVDEIFVIGCTESFQNDNFRCIERQKLCQNDISVSVKTFDLKMLQSLKTMVFRFLQSWNLASTSATLLRDFSNFKPIGPFQHQYRGLETFCGVVIKRLHGNHRIPKVAMVTIGCRWWHRNLRCRQSVTETMTTQSQVSVTRSLRSPFYQQGLT